jgi:hypothetical protein
MSENPQEAHNQTDNGDPSRTGLIMVYFKNGKTNVYLGAANGVRDEYNIVYRKAFPNNTHIMN